MRTLRRIQAASMHIAPHWALCVILGAYFSMQMAAPTAIVG